MAGRARLVQNSFTSGELSPRMAGRTDVAFYFNGAETVTNWIVFPQGGLKTRPGTRFVAEVKETNLANKIRLIPFQFNDAQSYVLEKGVGYYRFFRNTAQITAADTDAAITNGAFATDLAGWTTRNSGTGSAVWSAGTARLNSGAVGNEGRLYQEVAIGVAFRNTKHVLRVQVATASVILRIGASVGASGILANTTLAVGWHTVEFSPGGNASVFIEIEAPASASSNIDNVSLIDNGPVEIVHGSYASNDLFDVQFDQSGDVMWLTHRALKPKKISRRGHSSWSWNDYTPTNDPFTTATTFPRAVAFWKSRLWFGGTDSGPNEFWATQADDFENLNPGTSLDNEAINGVIAGGKINVIRTMSGVDKQLFVGTFGSEMFVRGDTSGKVSPSTVNIVPATDHGVSSLRPVKASGYLLFLQRSQRKIRQLTYDFNTDAFVAPDLLLLAEHLAKDKLLDLSYQEDADPIVWAVSTNGELLGVTFLPTHKILAWHRHDTTGIFTTAGAVTANGKFESVAVIPHPDGDRDQIWFIVRRTINGVEKRFVEVFEDGDGFYGQYTLDCALHYEDARNVGVTLSAVSGVGVTVTADSAIFVAGDVGKQLWHGDGLQHGALLVTGFTSSTVVTGDVVVDFDATRIDADQEEGVEGDTIFRIAVKTLTGLEHLNSSPVAVITDGATHPVLTVSGGAIVLDQFTAQAEVGLPYTPTLVALRPETQGGTIQGLTVTRSDIKLRVVDTATLTVNDHTLPERSSEDEMDEVVPLFSGDLSVPSLGWEDDGKVTVKQTTSQPATLLSLFGHVWFGDE